MNHIFCIHSYVVGHLGCFQLLAITNKAAMSIVELVPLWHGRASFRYIPKFGIAESFQVALFPTFWGTSRLISRVVVSVCNPTSNGGMFLFLHILSNMCCHLRFWSDWCKVSGLFWFAFLWSLRTLNISLGVSHSFEIPQLWNLCLDLFPIFWLSWFFWWLASWFFIYFG